MSTTSDDPLSSIQDLRQVFASHANTLHPHGFKATVTNHITKVMPFRPVELETASQQLNAIERRRCYTQSIDVSNFNQFNVASFSTGILHPALQRRAVIIHEDNVLSRNCDKSLRHIHSAAHRAGGSYTLDYGIATVLHIYDSFNPEDSYLGALLGGISLSIDKASSMKAWVVDGDESLIYHDVKVRVLLPSLLQMQRIFGVSPDSQFVRKLAKVRETTALSVAGFGTNRSLHKLTELSLCAMER